MAELIVKIENILGNIHKLDRLIKKRGMTWSLMVKMLSGNRLVLEKLFEDDVVRSLHSFGDSRLSSLRTIKSIDPSLRTMYIKPPAIKNIKSVVKHADVSFNTSLSTILALNREAQRQERIHEVLIMIEMGELREGVMREEIMDFYEKVFELSNVRILGIGTNLGCMYGVEPTYDKLIQLCLYKQLLEAKFNRKIELVSGGSSITLPLLTQNRVPDAMNHFRIGEAAFHGVSPLDNDRFDHLSMDTFDVRANIIELQEKAMIPDGTIGEANIGHTSDLSHFDEKQRRYRAIVDFGILDVDHGNLTPRDETVEFIGITSDMTVYDLGRDFEGGRTGSYRVGSELSFKPNYMAVARLFNSKFIEVKVI